MTAPNGYLQKHTQTYVGTNPSPHGALTWRMTMIAGLAPDEPDGVSSIYTILPIDSRVDSINSVTLFFNIDELPEVSRSLNRLTGLRQANAVMGMPLVNVRSTSIKHIAGIAPVATTQTGDNVAIYFDINSLPEIAKRKRRYTFSSNLYNSRSVDNLFADKPLFVNGNENAVVTFDIQSLDPA